LSPPYSAARHRTTSPRVDTPDGRIWAMSEEAREKPSNFVRDIILEHNRTGASAAA